MALRSFLVFAALFFFCVDASASVLWSNRNASVIRTLSGNVTTIDYDFWNNLLNQATADGSGGVVSVASQDVIIANEVVPMAMTEASSAAELAAGAAFLPEGAIFAVVGAALGALVWDAATQSYVTPGSTTDGTDTATCADGTAAEYFYGNTGPFSSVADGFKSTALYTQGWRIYSVAYDNTGAGQVTMWFPGNESSFNPGGLFTAKCDDNSSPSLNIQGTPVPPGELPPYILPWLQANPSSAPQLASKESSAGDYPQASPPLLSGPSSVSLPPVTTTKVNPDGSKSSSTSTTTEIINYSGPNATVAPQTVTTSSTTPAPTASDPNPAPIPGPTSSTSSPAPSPSSAPASPFLPPNVTVPPVASVPPGVVSLPIPNVDTSTGTCPAPIVLNIGLPGAETVTWDLTPWCNLADLLRPLVLTASALAAAVLLLR